MRRNRPNPGRAWRIPAIGSRLTPAAAALPVALALVPTAAEAACRLALLLALDVSSSVDAGEDRLQRAGVARALSSPDVRAALLGIPGAPVALAAYEWSGRFQQFPVLDWTLLESDADILRAAATISGSLRHTDRFPTAIGYALGHAASVFAAAPDCFMRTLDVSGDGVNNDGFGSALAYRNFPLDGITVNGLAVGGDPEVLNYYRGEVIRGPGSFVEEAADYGDYAEAMRRKLMREIATQVVGSLTPDQPAIAR